MQQVLGPKDFFFSFPIYFICGFYFFIIFLFFFPVLQHHCVVCPGERNKLYVPEGWSSLCGFSVLCNKLLRNLRICDPFQASSLSSTVLLCSQAGTCCATSEECFPYPCKMSLGFLLFICSMTYWVLSSRGACSIFQWYTRSLIKTCKGLLEKVTFDFSSILHFFSKCLSWYKGNWRGSVFHLRQK